VCLTEQGHSVEVFEASSQPGGQLVTLDEGGVLQDAFGAHIFHTEDLASWKFVNRYANFIPYRHRVLAQIASADGPRLLVWPPQVAELETLGEWPGIQHELSEAASPDPRVARDLESWTIRVFGPTLYSLFIKEYSEKQWGRPASLISSAWAPKRLELRSDGYLDFFRDSYQGWPSGGYSTMFAHMLDGLTVNYGVHVCAANIDRIGGFDGWIITGPLDSFFENSLGPLEWRGITVDHEFHEEGSGKFLPAPVVNNCTPEVSFTRRYESKWMSGQECRGTVVSTEYPNSIERYYPVYDVDGCNQRLGVRYRNLLHKFGAGRMIPAGRLATFSYINMDQAVRQGMNAARRLVALSTSLSRPLP
jgi:UDP-galactopyranose mutase